MDFFFCLPILFGCPTKVKPDGDQTPRVCPRCHNAAVIAAKSRMWFELCFVPLVPMSSKRVWVCSICQWSVPLQQGWEPPLPGGGNHHPAAQQAGYMSPQGQHPGYQPSPGGYQPGYINHGPQGGKTS